MRNSRALKLTAGEVFTGRRRQRKRKLHRHLTAGMKICETMVTVMRNWPAKPDTDSSLIRRRKAETFPWRNRRHLFIGKSIACCRHNRIHHLHHRDFRRNRRTERLDAGHEWRRRRERGVRCVIILRAATSHKEQSSEHHRCNRFARVKSAQMKFRSSHNSTYKIFV